MTERVNRGMLGEPEVAPSGDERLLQRVGWGGSPVRSEMNTWPDVDVGRSCFQYCPKSAEQWTWQHDGPILDAFAAAHPHHEAVRVDVLGPQPERFAEPETEPSPPAAYPRSSAYANSRV